MSQCHMQGINVTSASLTGLAVHTHSRWLETDSGVADTHRRHAHPHRCRLSSHHIHHISRLLSHTADSCTQTARSCSAAALLHLSRLHRKSQITGEGMLLGIKDTTSHKMPRLALRHKQDLIIQRECWEKVSVLMHIFNVSGLKMAYLCRWHCSCPGAGCQRKHTLGPLG